MIAPNAGEDVEKLNLLYIADGNVKHYNHSKKIVTFLNKLNIYLSYNSAISLLDIYPKDMKTCIHIGTDTQLYSQWPKTRNYLNALSVGEWLNELWYVHTVEYYSAIKQRNTPLIYINNLDGS